MALQLAISHLSQNSGFKKVFYFRKFTYNFWLSVPIWTMRITIRHVFPDEYSFSPVVRMCICLFPSSFPSSVYIMHSYNNAESEVSKSNSLTIQNLPSETLNFEYFHGLAFYYFSGTNTPFLDSSCIQPVVNHCC